MQSPPNLDPLPPPPEAWSPLLEVHQALRAPVERFLSREAAGGIVLLFASAIALIWANYGHESYELFWSAQFSLGFGPEPFTKSLHFWINDVSMTVFFLVAGAEIKRELRDGELAHRRRATLPVAAAIGGMLVPALIYICFNPSAPARHGWGIPMATDIAFALGVLSLLGRRVPASLRVLLLALAIIDDLGAILVIAIFYSSDIKLSGFLIVGLGLCLLWLWRRGGIRPGFLYMVPIVTIWWGFYVAGLHPTLAGVIVGLSAPGRARLGKDDFVNLAEGALREFREKAANAQDHHDILAPLRRLTLAGKEAVAPVIAAEATFHPLVAFIIIPVFALANAGVNIGHVDLAHNDASFVIWGVALGLAVGKPAGVLLFAWLSVRWNLCELPKGVTWTGMTIMGLVAGIGFTMSIFVAELAFPDPLLLNLAKLAILVATAFAGVTGLLLGRFALKPCSPEIAEVTAEQAESFTNYYQ